MWYLIQLNSVVFLALIIGVGGDCPPDYLVLDPPELIVRYGENVSVSCRSLFNHTNLHWTVSDLDIQTDTWQTDSLTDYEIQPVCHVTLDDASDCNKTLPIIVYKTPDQVSITIVDHTGPVDEGRMYELQCDIKNVAPVHLLNVSWYKGHILIKNITFTEFSTKNPISKSSRLQILPGKGDHGVQYRCEAQLNLGAKGHQQSSTVTAADLTITLSSHVYNCSDLELDPPELVVRYGDSASVSCRSLSNQTGLEWRVPLGNVTHFNQTVIWETDSLTDYLIQPVCNVTVNGVQCSKILPIIVYKLPDEVYMSIANHIGQMTEGKKYDLQCDIMNFAPLNALAVSWYKGNVTLRNRGFAELPIKIPSNKTVTLKITASKDAGEAPYRCEARLKLGPKGPQPPPVVQSNRLNVTVDYKPVINCSDWFPMINTTLNLYPYKFMGNPTPVITWLRDKSPISPNMRLGMNDSGRYNYIASNKIGTTSCLIQITVEYAPRFECPESYSGTEKESFSGKCSVKASPAANITWEKDGVIVKPLRTLTRGDTGNYVIRAENKHGVKQHEVIINVLSSCEIELQPAKLVVAYNTSATAECSTTATHLGIGWEASQGAVNMVEDVQSITWRVKNLTHWDIQPICFMNTEHTQCLHNLPVIIYKHPDQVSISTVHHTGPMIEGRQYKLQCDVLNVAPVRFLTVTLYKGQERVKNITFEDHSSKFPENINFTHWISASRNDHGVQYRCEAELNLGPEGPQPHPTVSSDPLNIIVHYKPVGDCSGWSPMINTPLNAYPHTFTGNPTPAITWFRDDSQISPDMRLSMNDSGQYRVVASNLMGNASCVTQITVEYAPTFECPESYQGREKNSFSGECSVKASPAANITWEKDGVIVKPLRTLTRGETGYYMITAENKHGVKQHKVFIDVLYKPVGDCSGWSPVINTPLNAYPYTFTGNPTPAITWFRDDSQISTDMRFSMNDSGQYRVVASNLMGNASCVTQITVEYAPTFECPKSYSGTENESFSGECSVKASPAANITWGKNGVIVKPLHTLTRGDTGNYVIRAENKHGVKQHKVFIDVLYPPKIKLNKKQQSVTTGGDVSLNCTAEGNPVPDVKWIFQNQTKTTRRRQATLNITKASSADAGEYMCIATNYLGEDKDNISLSISESYFRLIIIWCLVLVLVIIIIICIYFVWLKKKRSGRYNIEGNGAVRMSLLKSSDGKANTKNTS